jgi:hypothetical protein
MPTGIQIIFKSTGKYILIDCLSNSPTLKENYTIAQAWITKSRSRYQTRCLYGSDKYGFEWSHHRRNYTINSSQITRRQTQSMPGTVILSRQYGQYCNLSSVGLIFREWIGVLSQEVPYR